MGFPNTSSYEIPGVELMRPASSVAVWVVRREDPFDGTATPLPNVQVVEIRRAVGADPGHARFRYVLDQLAESYYGISADFADYYPLATRLPADSYARTDDRILVTVDLADGFRKVLFHGYAQSPEVAVSPDESHATFTAIGVATRLWDDVFAGAVCRDAIPPEDATRLPDIPTDLPLRFNPGHLANATPADQDSGSGDQTYPVFVDALYAKAHKEFGARRWTLPMAVRYVLGTAIGNVGVDGARDVVDFGGFSALDDVLRAWKPAVGDWYDVDDPATFVAEDIVLTDTDITGMTVPEALERLLAPHGFTFCFHTEESASGTPWTWLEVLRAVDCPSWAVRLVALQESAAGGTDLDPGATNVGAMQVARDMGRLANAALVIGAPVEREVSLVLAPLFRVAVGDAADAARERFIKDSSQWDITYKDSYRLYGFDEACEGYWDFKQSDFVTQSPTALDPILGAPGDDGIPTYAVRRRPGKSPVFTTDANGERRKAELHVSFDTPAGAPAPYTTGGTWHAVDDSAWELCDDRLAIRLTGDDPNHLKYADYTASDAVATVNSGVCRTVEWTADPSTWDPDVGSNRPAFLLTCVLEADKAVVGAAPRRAGASPTRFEVLSLREDRDHYHKQLVAESSIYSGGPGAGDVAADGNGLGDDAPACEARAVALRSYRELPEQAGTVEIPRLDLAYRCGDFLGGVAGKAMSLRGNLSGGGLQSAVYPMVVSIAYMLDGRQSTTLALADRRAEPPPAVVRG